MPVTSSQIANALAQGRFKPEIVKFESDGNAGQFNTSSLGASTNGVLTNVQVGSDAPISDAVAVYIGQFLRPNGHLPPQVKGTTPGAQFLAGQTRGKRIRTRLRTSGSADAQASARVGIGVWKAPEISEPNVLDLFNYEDHDPNGVTNETDIPIHTPEDLGFAVAAESEYINVVANPGATGAETYQFNEGSSVLHVPVLKWDGTGL